MRCYRGLVVRGKFIACTGIGGQNGDLRQRLAVARLMNCGKKDAVLIESEDDRLPGTHLDG